MIGDILTIKPNFYTEYMGAVSYTHLTLPTNSRV